MLFDGVDDYVYYEVGTASQTAFANKTIKATAIFRSIATSQVVFSHGAGGARLYLNSATGTLHVGSNTNTSYAVVVNTLYNLELDINSSGLPVALRVDGVTAWSNPSGVAADPVAGTKFSVGARQTSGVFGLFFDGVIYNVEISDTLAWAGSGASTSDWADTIGSNDGIIVGSPVAYNSDGMYFDSTTTYISLDSAVTLTGVFEIEFDMIRANSSKTHIMLGGVGVENKIFMSTSGTNISVRINNTTQSFTANISPGRLYTINISRNGSNSVTLKVNGSTIASATIAGTFTFNKIGVDEASNEFDGMIKNVKVKDSALIHKWVGDGIADANWTDEVGTNDGTVNGTATAYAAQGLLAHVVDVYDLPGGNDADNTTAAKQPELIIDGALQTIGDQPAAYYTASRTDYIRIPDDASLEPASDKLTVIAVIEADLTVSRGIASKYQTSPNNRSWRFRVTETGAIDLYISDDGSTTVSKASSSGIVSANTPTVVAFTFNAGNIKFFVNNGTALNEGTTAVTELYNGTGDVVIGAAYYFSTNYLEPFEGLIGDVIIAQDDLSGSMGEIMEVLKTKYGIA
jgi:hypothetical protein